MRTAMAVAGVVLGGMLSGAAVAQGPPPGAKMPPMQFTNLQVLPKDTTPEELMKTMHGFSASLGVHCGFCHAGDPATHHMDFASDAKPEKKAARVMMQMTQTINEKYLTQLGGPEHEHHDDDTVTCYTCHRGHTEPDAKMPEMHEMPPGGAPQH